MPSQLILHKTTHQQVERFIASPAHAVLITGPDGTGKGALAEYIIANLLAIEPGKLGNYPHLMRIEPDGTSISIEKIRELQRFLQLKTIGTNPLRRALIIEHANTLTTEAQNAYLKLLEEPPADTVLVMTANNPRSLLPTILSRLQTITAHAPTSDQIQPLLKASGKDETACRQAYFLSGGLPGLLSALLNDDETHPILASVASAKEILQKPTFERLCLAESLSKQKENAANTLDALDRIAQTGIEGAAAKGNTQKLKQWHAIRKLTAEARQNLAKNANIKLTLSNLFLQLPG